MSKPRRASLVFSGALLLWGCGGGGRGPSGAAGRGGQDAAAGSAVDASARDAGEAGGSGGSGQAGGSGGLRDARDAATERADAGTAGQAACAPLPMTGRAVDVAPSADLVAAVRNAAAGDTLLLANGTYALGGVIVQIIADGVTLRGKSGDREAVILDGQRSASTGEVISVTGSDVTIADLTVVNAYTHAIHVQATAAKDTLRTTIYNVHVKDALQQGIKINQDPGETHAPDDGLVACSHIELTAAGRPNVRDNCYTGGIDAHHARGWRVRDNVIEGFYCASGLSEHGVHFWTGSRDTIVERNHILNSARGVGFGLGETTASSTDSWRTYPDAPCGTKTPVGHYGGVIRNNFIFANDAGLFASAAGFDSGIDFEQACGATAVHNTIYGTTPPASSAIEWRFANTSVTVLNNLANAAFKDRGGGATASAQGNIAMAAASNFVDATRGDLHLSASAAGIGGAGVSVAAGLCDDDVDGQPRPAARDVGADQVSF